MTTTQELDARLDQLRTLGDFEGMDRLEAVDLIAALVTNDRRIAGVKVAKNAFGLTLSGAKTIVVDQTYGMGFDAAKSHLMNAFNLYTADRFGESVDPSTGDIIIRLPYEDEDA